MAINWDKFVNRDRGTLLFGGVFSFAAALVMLFSYFDKVKIKSKDDIAFIKGLFNEYRWVDLGGRNGSSLTFTLQNYSTRFKIKADFFSILQKEKFIKIPYGDTLILGIPNSHAKYLNTSKDPFFVYSISSNYLTYLDLNKVITKHKSPFLLFVAVLFGIGGYFLVYFGRKAKVNTAFFVES